jgi:hypothetical protein
MVRTMVAQGLVVGNGWDSYFKDMESDTHDTGVQMKITFESKRDAIDFLEDYYG